MVYSRTIDPDVMLFPGIVSLLISLSYHLNKVTLAKNNLFLMISGRRRVNVLVSVSFPLLSRCSESVSTSNGFSLSHRWIMKVPSVLGSAASIRRRWKQVGTGSGGSGLYCYGVLFLSSKSGVR